MAKLAIFFVVLFCIVQIALSARTVRDAPELPTGEEIKNYFNQAGEKLKGLASEQNIQSAKDALSSVGDTISEGFSKLSAKVKETAESISAPVPAN